MTMVVLTDLPDQCLQIIFQSLGASDRNMCALVCKGWLAAEGRSRHRLCLLAPAEVLVLPSALFDRFNAVSDLTLNSRRSKDHIGDEAVALISARCPSLVRLELSECRRISYNGMLTVAKNCSSLRELCCVGCNFGTKGVSAVLSHCPLLQVISIKRLRNCTIDIVIPSEGAPSLIVISLEDLHCDGKRFVPLVAASPNLRVLKVSGCPGDWSSLLEALPDRVPHLVGVRLERIQISDQALSALSSCASLEVLSVVDTRESHVLSTHRIGGDWLLAIARRCSHLRQLGLSRVNPTIESLRLIAIKCEMLEELSLFSSEATGDDEISCIASKCWALKKLSIKGCPISNQSLEALAGGCPSLEKVMIDECSAVTFKGAEYLISTRKCVTVYLNQMDVQCIRLVREIISTIDLSSIAKFRPSS